MLLERLPSQGGKARPPGPEAPLARKCSESATQQDVLPAVEMSPITVLSTVVLPVTCGY